MDMWPGKIAGFHAGDTLEAEGAVRALKTAPKELPVCILISFIRTEGFNTQEPACAGEL
jgi:hypothetical protein